MITETFKAGSHYGDFTGTAAADSLEFHGFQELLKSQGLIKDEEYLVGIEASASAPLAAPAQINSLSVTALLTNNNGYQNTQAAIDSGSPLKVRKVKLDIPIADFFSLFKQFQISISKKGMIDQREITFDHQ